MFTRVVIHSVSHTTNELSKFQATEVLSRYGQHRPLVLKSRERLLAVFAHNFLLAGGVSCWPGRYMSKRSMMIQWAPDVCVRKQRCVHTRTILSADADVTLRLLRASGRDGARVLVSGDLVLQLHSGPRKEGFTKSYVLPECQSSLVSPGAVAVPGPALYSPSC